MSRPSLKFCMVTTFYPPYNFGGDGIFVHRLANELAQRGHRVDVVHSLDAYQALAPGGPTAASSFPNHPSVTVHSLDGRGGILSPLITQQTGTPGLKTSRLKGILEQGDYDVIHYHNMSLVGPTALGYGSAIKLMTMHEHWLVCPTHVLWKFDKAPCTSRNCFACTIHSGRPPQLWRYTGLLDRMLRHVDAFIAGSHFSRVKHREMGLNVQAPILVNPPFVPHPSETPPAIRADGHSEQTRPYFLYVGRLEKVKGVQVLVDAFRDYRNADLLVVGDGDYAPTLRRQADGLERVRFLGHQSQEKVAELYGGAVALLVPSIGYETFGLVVAEAHSHRTPVIVNNLGPLPELVDQSGGGMVYSDEVGLLSAMESLRSNPRLREELAESAYSYYLKYWTPEAHLTRYFELIGRVAAAKGIELNALEHAS